MTTRADFIAVSRGANADPWDMYASTAAVTQAAAVKPPPKTYSPPAPPASRPTGYSSNFRPGCNYDSSQDPDPIMRTLCAPKVHYLTSQTQSFAAPKVNRTIQPENAATSTSGFVKEVPHTIPTSKEVYEKFGDTQLLVGIRPTTTARSITTLRDPLPRENAGTGPNYMSTEARANFVPKPVYPNTMEKSQTPIGPSQHTGFTSNTESDTILDRPSSPHNAFPFPAQYPQTLVQESFKAPGITKGDEHLPPLAFNGHQATAYTRECARSFPERVSQEKLFGGKSVVPSQTTERIRRNDPADYLNVAHPQPYLSTTRTQFNSQAFRDHESRIVVPRFGRYTVGKPIESGYSENEDKFISPTPTAADQGRFASVYATTYPKWLNKSEAGVERAEPSQTAFARGTNARHKTWTAAVPVDQVLRSVRPEIALTMIRRDPSLLEDRHAHKRRTLSQT